MFCGTAFGVENSSEIESLRNEMSSIKKSVANVDTLSENVEVLQRQMVAFLKWHSDVSNFALHLQKEAAQAVSQVEKRVTDLREWRSQSEKNASNVLSRSDFDEWLKSNYAEAS